MNPQKGWGFCWLSSIYRLELQNRGASLASNNAMAVVAAAVKCFTNYNYMEINKQEHKCNCNWGGRDMCV